MKNREKIIKITCLVIAGSMIFSALAAMFALFL